jgi:hypothetical protein
LVYGKYLGIADKVTTFSRKQVEGILSRKALIPGETIIRIKPAGNQPEQEGKFGECLSCKDKNLKATSNATDESKRQIAVEAGQRMCAEVAVDNKKPRKVCVRVLSESEASSTKGGVSQIITVQVDREPLSAGGAAPCRYVLYNKHRYRVRMQNRRPCIIVHDTPVFLGDLRKKRIPYSTI